MRSFRALDFVWVILMAEQAGSASRFGNLNAVEGQDKLDSCMYFINQPRRNVFDDMDWAAHIS